MSNYIGEIAGLATSFFFAINAIFITKASHEVGAVISNRARVAFALTYLILINLMFFHEPLPWHAGANAWTWLSLSGVIGLAFGDLFVFQSFVLVGPLIGSLLLSLSPIIGALEAWIIFHESLAVPKVIGIVLTLAGIVWVVLARDRSEEGESPHRLRGVVFGVLSAICQATGLILSRQGMGSELAAFQANAIRMLAALLTLLIIMLLQKQTRGTFQALRQNPRTLQLLAVAGFIGPLLGVSASLLAVQHAEVGVASTLTSLSPVLVLPFGYFFLKEHIRWQAVAGTMLAVVGVAILFLS